MKVRVKDYTVCKGLLGVLLGVLTDQVNVMPVRRRLQFSDLVDDGVVAVDEMRKKEIDAFVRKQDHVLQGQGSEVLRFTVHGISIGTSKWIAKGYAIIRSDMVLAKIITSKSRVGM